LKKVVFPAPFGPMMPTMPGARQVERQPVDEQPVAEALAQVARDHHVVAEPRRRRDHDLVRRHLLLLRLAGELLVGLQARLALALPRARRHPHPLELAVERALAGALRLLLLGQPVALLLQPPRVVPLVRHAAPAVELEDPLGDVVEEVPVVRDRHHGARERLEVVLQPRHALGVEVVGGLVEQEHVGLLEQHLAQRDAAALAARELRHVGVAGRQAQRVHGDLDLVVEIPEVVLVDVLLHLRLLVHQLVEVGVGLGERGADLVEAVEHPALVRQRELHVAAHVERRVELRLLRQVADARALVRPRLALKVLVGAGHDAQQARLARAVGPEHADLRARIEREPDVVKDDPRGRDHLAQALHDVDELGGQVERLRSDADGVVGLAWET
jgi:hypothetical protein